MAKLITIAGGGLAGLSCGVGLRSLGVPVELHEAGFYPRHRVCGEFISGVSDSCLDELGITECFEGAATLRTMAWFSHGKCLLRADLPASARGISRKLLDQRLRDVLIERGGKVHEGSRFDRPPSEGTLWCTGRARSPSPWVGLKTHFAGLKLEADLEMHLGKSSYLGLCHIEEGIVNACGLFPASHVQKGSAPIQSAIENSMGKALTRRISSAKPVAGSPVAVAGFRTGWQRPPGGRVPSIGDSLAMIPPFTGNGMSMAFEGALEAVHALTPYAKDSETWSGATKSLQFALDKNFRRRMLVSEFLHPFLTHGVGQRLLALGTRLGILPANSVFAILRSP